MEIYKYGQTEIDYLKKKDKKLGAAIERIGMIEREVIPDLFAALINSIVGQQISAKAALTVWNRLQETLGTITPESVVNASIESIQQCGLSIRKAWYIKGIGEAVAEGKLDLSDFNQLTDNEVIKKLMLLNGIGKWSAEMLLIFSMQRPDVMSCGDFGIQRGIMKLYGHKSLSGEQLLRYKKRYSPYGTVASFYLWELAKE
jgi:DNA-3-methyladenine glycosylase II